MVRGGLDGQAGHDIDTTRSVVGPPLRVPAAAPSTARATGHPAEPARGARATRDELRDLGRLRRSV